MCILCEEEGVKNVLNKDGGRVHEGNKVKSKPNEVGRKPLYY